jgi:hypothetical protein
MIERDDLRDSGRQPPPGQGVIIGLGLALGVLLMTVQLWLLTLAFDLYLGGQRSETVVAAVISGLVFLGGLAMLRVLDRGPRRRR